MKKLVFRACKRFLPSPMLGVARRYWRTHRQRRFLRQGSITVRVAGIDLEIPDDHPLPGFIAAQPLRDLCVGITARHVGGKYPGHTIIDIGANVGDTAAILAEHCPNPLLLVEASDFFHGYLVRNLEKIGNPTSIRKVLVADGSPITGELFHWGGTAEWKESAGAASTPTERLGDLTSDPVAMVKTDTDGHDFKILQSGIDWLAERKPVVLFESRIQNPADFSDLVTLIGDMHEAGYQGFVIWDDAGIHLLSTTDHLAVIDVHRYLLKCLEKRTKRSISNYDVACFHACDDDVFRKVSDSYRTGEF